MAAINHNGDTVRPTKFTPVAQDQAIEVYAKTRSRIAAADAAGISGRTLEWYLANDPDFASRFKDAGDRFVKGLEDEAYRRAVEGVSVPKTVAGTSVNVTEYSDSLLLHLLKKNAPEKHGDKQVVKHEGAIKKEIGIGELDAEDREMLRRMLEKHANEEES